MSFRLVDQPHDRPEFISETLDLVTRTLDELRAQLLARVAAASDHDLDGGTEEDWSLGMVAYHVLVVERGMTGIALRLARGELPASTGQPRPVVGSTTRAVILEAAEKAARAVQRLRAEFPSAPNITLTAPSPYYGPFNCFAWLHVSTFHYRAHLAALERGVKSAL